MVDVLVLGVAIGLGGNWQVGNAASAVAAAEGAATSHGGGGGHKDSHEGWGGRKDGRTLMAGPQQEEGIQG